MGEANTSPRRLRAAEKRVQAVEMRREGATFEAIAETLGCSRGMAFRYVTDEMDRLAKELAENTQQMLDLELGRLDALTRAVFPLAQDGDLQAVDRMLKIMERRAKLMGLDAPQRTEVSGRGGGPLKTERIGLSGLLKEAQKMRQQDNTGDA